MTFGNEKTVTQHDCLFEADEGRSNTRRRLLLMTVYDLDHISQIIMRKHNAASDMELAAASRLLTPSADVYQFCFETGIHLFETKSSKLSLIPRLGPQSSSQQ